MKRLLRILRNLLIDFKYQKRYIRGIKKTKTNIAGVKSDSPTDPFVLDSLFRNIKIKENDILVDIGCGRGRVINWWLSKGFRNKIIGIEIDHELAKNTKNRLSKYTNVEIITANATEFIPKEGTIFYLFNPFDRNLLVNFIAKFKTIFYNNKYIKIIYYNCTEIDIFESDIFWNVNYIYLGKIYHKAAYITIR